MSKLAVVAIGGNSLIKDDKKVSFADQYKTIVNTAEHILCLINHGYKVVVTHGNGPHIGFALRRSELAESEVHGLPLDVCVAQTQGEIGYIMVMAINYVLMIKGYNFSAVNVITRVRVSEADASFKRPSKPIGSFMTKTRAEHMKKNFNWDVIEDAGRGYRRVVSSPTPLEIMELHAIKSMLEKNVVIAGGGGGIPVYSDKNGRLHGIEAVIDKDKLSSLMAINLNADLLVITTGVDKVALNYGKDNQKNIGLVSVKELEKYASNGYFAKGSMLPKVEACIEFVKKTGNKAIITSPHRLYLALDDKDGTVISN